MLVFWCSLIKGSPSVYAFLLCPFYPESQIQNERISINKNVDACKDIDVLSYALPWKDTCRWMLKQE